MGQAGLPWLNHLGQPLYGLESTNDGRRLCRGILHLRGKEVAEAIGVDGGTVGEVAEARVAAFQIRGTLRRTSRKLQVEGAKGGV